MGAAERIKGKLAIDVEKIKRKLVEFIKREVKKAGAKGVVVGMSGGVDSSAVAALCAEALGPKHVLGICMPEAGVTAPVDVADAREVARRLGIGFRVVDITPALLGVRKNITDFKPSARIPVANIKPRVRMTILYYYANVLNYLVVGSANRSELRAGYFCYDEHTRAFTTEGLKYYSELKPGDIVLSLNPKTGRVEEKSIANVYSFHYDGEMLHFKGKRTDLMVTPNHRMLTRGSDGSLRFRPANECLGRRIGLPIPAPWEGKVIPPPFIDLNAFCDQSKLPWNAKRLEPLPRDEFLYLLGLFIGDGTAYRGRVRAEVKTDLDQRQYARYRDEEGRFTNYPGTNQSRKAYDTHEIFFSIPVGDPARQSLEKILLRNKIKYSSTPNVVRIHSRALFETFRTCGNGARYKCIPRWVLQYPARDLECLFKGLMDSDGSRGKGMYRTSSYQLALDLVELCAKMGKHATIHVKSPKETEHRGKKIRSGVSYIVTFPQKISQTSIYPDDVKKVNYKGTVWCPDIPGTHNLLVERNGKFAFCGNTKYGDGGADLLPLGCLYKTQVKQLAAHLHIPKKIIEKVPSAGLWRGQTDEEELGLPYEKLDMIYCGLDAKLRPEIIAEAVGVGVGKVRRFIERERRTCHKLLPPPIPKL